MSRKYLNNRWCVRCGKETPTPYLKKNMKLLPQQGTVLDIGCGNGRNSRHMLALGYKIMACDMAPPSFGIPMTLGHDPLPKGKYDVILVNYILMFLNTKERKQVMSEILERSKKGTTMMIEMYPAKDAYDYNFDSIVDYFANRGWETLRKSRAGGGKTVLKRTTN